MIEKASIKIKASIKLDKYENIIIKDTYGTRFDLQFAGVYPLALLAVLAGGIMTSFTPCVYPLLPITTTFIGARSSGSRKKAFFLSLAYALGISITYTTLGLIASFSGRLFDRTRTNPLLFLVISNIFIIMGLSMLGVFSFSWPNMVKQLPQTKSGFIGSFLMGLVAGLVMGPCTAPVLALLLVY